MKVDLNPMNGLLKNVRQIKEVAERSNEILVTDGVKNGNITIECVNCGMKIYPLRGVMRCACGNLQVDEEKSNSQIIWLKDHQPKPFTVTPIKEPTFKEKILDMFKSKNKAC